MRIENGILYDVNEQDLKLLENKPKKFWKDVKFLGDGCFSNCTQLKEIEIPNTVVLAHENPFNGCDNLEKFIVSSSHKYFSISEDGSLLLTKNGTGLIAGAPKVCKLVTIPEGVEEIFSFAFANNKKLTRVNFPKSLKSIGWGAFENTSLRAAVISKNVDYVYYDSFKINNLKEIDVELENGKTASIEAEVVNELFFECGTDMKNVREKCAQIKKEQETAEMFKKYSSKNKTVKQKEEPKLVSERQEFFNKFIIKNKDREQ